MNLFLDSFWRALAYCLHPRVIALSLLPLLIMVALSLGLGYFYWEPAVDWVFLRLQSWDLFVRTAAWLQELGAGNLKTLVAPLVLILAMTPVVVLLSLLVVALLMAPALVAMVGKRRFPDLERKRGSSFFASVLWSLGSTVLALIELLVSMPLWLLPPLILILPPLIWGWLTYRVMAFDALAEHASKQERREVFRRHRRWLLAMGVVTGYLGAAPTLVWASGVLFVAAFVVLIPVAIWIYTLVFAFSALWFSHYGLAALEQLRRQDTGPVAWGDVEPPNP